MKEAAAEFLELVRSGARKDQLRNGANGKQGLNHINELFMMLEDEGMTGEFKIRE